MYCELKEKVNSLKEREQFKAVACLSPKIFNGMYTKVLEKILFFFLPLSPYSEAHRVSLSQKKEANPLRVTDTVSVVVHIYFNTALYISSFMNIFSAYSTDSYNQQLQWISLTNQNFHHNTMKDW